MPELNGEGTCTGKQGQLHFSFGHQAGAGISRVAALEAALQQREFQLQQMAQTMKGASADFDEQMRQLDAVQEELFRELKTEQRRRQAVEVESMGLKVTLQHAAQRERESQSGRGAAQAALASRRFGRRSRNVELAALVPEPARLFGSNDGDNSDANKGRLSVDVFALHPALRELEEMVGEHGHL